LSRELVEELVNAIRTAVTRVPRDVYEAIRRGFERERSPLAKRILSTMLRSIEVAARESIPLCQDTGYPCFLLEVGYGFHRLREVVEAIHRAVVEATRMGVLRPNVVDAATNRNTGTNTGIEAPQIEIDLVEGDRARITFLPRGGGCEGVSKLYTLSPSRGWADLARAVVDAVIEAGPKPCPPTFISIGVGGTAYQAVKLARRGLAAKWWSLSDREKRILERVNELGIGPQGLGGDTTCLGIRVVAGSRHPATFVAAVLFSCWALRRATIVVDNDLGVEKDPDDFWSP